ncbi:mechanosensitive ion channel family protein [Sphingomonas xinjiangensis]|uniref:Small-conductance mechanosensitive channel n=1 Tax=Sphingomonas xinjiangensis TaxID=643568 RepID=A0A840YG45_9SPHN|nr:mechanosensitive ion channel domain-containing protein [Sphingomonas xinjiangensis]MBB5711804.1 small-conductance mechanosensitive channel [Sphingomonas xinjiangensis]
MQRHPRHLARSSPGSAAILALALFALLLGGANSAAAQDLAPAATPTQAAAQAAIAARTDSQSDSDIRGRIRSIFLEVSGLRDVRVRVSAGVVTLAGTVPTAGDVDRAEAIAGRVAGVVTVQNDLERDLKVDSNLTPALGKFGDDLRGIVRGLPLIGVALAIGLLIGGLGYLLASFGGLWRRVTPNMFLAELLATLVRFAFVVLGIVAGLEVLGATALLGAVLGGAGVIGIAIGFAVRDTVDNYVSSLMLSLRQPFRANDHVVIEGNEGRVVRLTSRATILMTLEGNHLRIPNATVFKAVILNYTRNPERRFDFDLGVDAENDPVDGMAVGLQAIRDLNFVLATPPSTAIIREVGDSNIVLRFFGWIDQSRTDYLKGRSLALDAAKRALEGAGFALPEPIYRLRFDQGAALPIQGAFDASAAKPLKPRTSEIKERADQYAAPEAHIAKLVDEERAETKGGDLLDDRRPIE